MTPVPAQSINTLGYANKSGYSDITPHEIIKVVSDKTMEVREMNADRDPTWEGVFHVGGFSANCSNQNEQRWFITSTPTNHVFRIRRGKGGWKDAHGNKFSLSDKPRRFYDYNF